MANNTRVLSKAGASPKMIYRMMMISAVLVVIFVVGFVGTMMVNANASVDADADPPAALEFNESEVLESLFEKDIRTQFSGSVTPVLTPEEFADKLREIRESTDLTPEEVQVLSDLNERGIALVYAG